MILLPRGLPAARRGGDERVRTDDPLLAKQVLSQLSYTPIFTYEGLPSQEGLSLPSLRYSFPGPSKLNNDQTSGLAPT